MIFEKHRCFASGAGLAIELTAHSWQCHRGLQFELPVASLLPIASSKIEVLGPADSWAHQFEYSHLVSDINDRSVTVNKDWISHPEQLQVTEGLSKLSLGKLEHTFG